MPRQLLFYMSKEDETGFLDFLRSTGVAILPAISQTAEFAPLDVLPEVSQDPSTRRFWLQNTTISLPMVTDFEKDRGYYVVNGFQSPVAEFLRSFTVSQMMLPGRLEADMAYFDDEKQDLVSKPPEFRNWFDSIERWIRKKYRHLTLLTFVGPGAEKFRDEGGLLH